MQIGQRHQYCPTCGQQTEILQDKPWLPGLCTECGTMLDS